MYGEKHSIYRQGSIPVYSVWFQQTTYLQMYKPTIWWSSLTLLLPYNSSTFIWPLKRAKEPEWSRACHYCSCNVIWARTSFTLSRPWGLCLFFFFFFIQLVWILQLISSMKHNESPDFSMIKFIYVTKKYLYPLNFSKQTEKEYSSPFLSVVFLSEVQKY